MNLPLAGCGQLLPQRILARWLSGVGSVSPRDTLWGATGGTALSTWVLERGLAGPCALSEENVIQERRGERHRFLQRLG